MKKEKTKELVFGAMIAALYAAMTLLGEVFGLSFGNIQCRFSEALTILPTLTPAAVPGLTIGCILGNIASPFGIYDIVFGSCATLLAAISSRVFRNIRLFNLPILSSLMPVVFNSLIIGAEIAVFTKGNTIPVFLYSALTVGAGELIVCTLLGLPLFKLAESKKFFSGD